MDSSSFVEGVYVAVYEGAIDDVVTLLSDSPGRAPSPRIIALSEWYRALEASDAKHVEEVIRLSVDLAVFGFLAVLDGVRAVDNDATELTLLADGEPMNEFGDFHDRFRSLADGDET